MLKVTESPKFSGPCKGGYFRNTTMKTCRKCPDDHFSAELAGICTKCPDGTSANDLRTKCRKFFNFYFKVNCYYSIILHQKAFESDNSHTSHISTVFQLPFIL